MTDPAWAEGYVVDVDYVDGYYRELAPAMLRFVALLAGVETTLDQRFTCYELGCGNGRSLVLHAAANPLGQFIGVDFNPAHIQSAQQLAKDGGVTNVRFLEKSFADLLEIELTDADIIALHGVWSWVGDEQRQQILELMRRRLKPAGIAYLSYNCLPGLAAVAPLQRLLMEHAALGAGESVGRMHRALDFATRLDSAGADYFSMNPLAKARLDSLAGHDARYLTHEYLNAHWTPFYYADVARALVGSGLAYAGSADLVRNFRQFVLKPEIAAIVGGVGDPIFAETLKDYATNQVFRKDVYTRGAPPAAPAVRESLLDATRFALARPRSNCRLTRATPIGEVTLQEEVYAPVLDSLARAPMTFAALARAPETAKLDRNHLRQAVFGMAALGNVWPALPEAGEDARRAAVSGLNRALLRDAARDGTLMLASPVVGAGVPLGPVERICLESPGDEAGTLERARKAIVARTRQEAQERRPPGRDSEAAVEEQVRFFFRELLPFYRMLGVAE